MNAQQFFERALPEVARIRRKLFDSVRGTVCIIVHGEGAWTVTFGDHQAEDAVQPQVTPDADLVVAFDADSFSQVMRGEAPDKVPVTLGDVRLLERLGRLLEEPARGGLGARLQNR